MAGAVKNSHLWPYNLRHADGCSPSQVQSQRAGANAAEFATLPSTREARIQVAKLGRMANEFHKRFPWEVIAVPEKKANKSKGELRHRLKQQDRIVDKLLGRVLEEHAMHSFKAKPGQVKRSRGLVKKYIENMNRQIYRKLDQELLRASQGAINLKALTK